MKTIRRALISVSDKTGLIPFARYLAKQKVEILSTGGTLKAMQEAGIDAVPVDNFTGFPEILEGRVKTLHPKIHGGLLYRRDKKSHTAEAKQHGIEPIDLVVVNLYPFERVTQNEDVTLETAIENIDIGGPSMLRSAAKNYKSVAVVCDPSDYTALMHDMQANKGAVSQKLKSQLARKVFERTSNYDTAIARYLSNGKVAAKEAPKVELPPTLNMRFNKYSELRYGENPHQPAAFYSAEDKPAFKQLQGKELSFNNYLDIEAACDIIREFSKPAVCVVKHNNPCGVAEGKTIPEALQGAIECDAMSAFGGIIAINRPCDKATAQLTLDMLRFFEVFIAPRFEPAAARLFKKKQNLRLIETGELGAPKALDLRFLQKGILAQAKDMPLESDLKAFKKKLRFVTKKKLSGDAVDELIFAWKCAKVVKSNAIVITQGLQTVGIGAGQMSRVDAVEIACRKAGYRTEGGILASDAFFPMPDSIEVAHQYKIRAIIQPGGSVKDADVIQACDDLGIAMAFTSKRHFRH